jgi:ATP-dependent RNA helicase RhlE
MSFSKLGLHPALERRCEALGYIEPTQIQRQAIPLILSGSDLIGCAETGTGKTAAFLLPMIQRIYSAPGDGVRALILAPTRELASQIATNLHALDTKGRVRSATLIGGASLGRQLEGLRSATPVVIATPGRLLDHIERGSVDLSQVEMFVIDEADRMLDMGFWPDINEVIAKLPARRQTMLFSATMSPYIEKIARSTMRQPRIIEVGPRGRAAETVDQSAYPVAMESKTALLLHLLEREHYTRVLVFTRTRRGAERLSHILAAREVHRIGRTGRAGNPGRAVTLITPVEELSMSAIERFTGQAIERVLLPGFGGHGASLQISTGTFKSFGGRGSGGNHSFRSRRTRR